MAKVLQTTKTDRKRANGEGSWSKHKKKNGSEFWEYRVCFGEDLIGEVIRKSFSGDTQRECRNKANKFRDDLTNQAIAIEEYTLGDWLDTWLPTYKKQSVSEGTYDNYLYQIGIIKKHSLSKMLLPKIKPIHITQFFNDIGHYSASVIDKCSTLMFGSFEDAIDNDLCYKNPVKRATKPQKEEKEKVPFNPDEVAKIKEYAPQDEFGLMMVLLLETGMRSQELRALRWGKIRLEEKYILIDKAIKKNGDEGLPKGKRIRIIPLEDELNKLLRHYVGQYKNSPKALVLTPQENPKRKKKKGEGVMGKDNFVTEDSLRWQYDSFLSRMNQYLAEKEQAPVRLLSPHSTRHTYATKLGQKGVPHKAIQLILGHADAKTTDGYTHLSELSYLLDAIQK